MTNPCMTQHQILLALPHRSEPSASAPTPAPIIECDQAPALTRPIADSARLPGYLTQPGRQ